MYNLLVLIWFLELAFVQPYLKPGTNGMIFGVLDLDCQVRTVPRPLNSRNTVVLTVVDWFAKMAHLYHIPLPKLPSSVETGELLTQHVFRLHGIPRDIVWRSTVYVPGMACFRQGSRDNSEPFLRSTPGVEWPDRAGEPVSGEHIEMCGVTSSDILELLATLGRIRPQLPSFNRGGGVPLLGCTRMLASNIRRGRPLLHWSSIATGVCQVYSIK